MTASLREGVRRSAETLRVEPAVFLEACWHVVISRLSGDAEVFSDTSFDGRRHEELAGALGALTQSVLLSSRVEAETSFAEVVDQVRRGRAAAEQWLDYQPVALDAPHTFGLGFDYVAAEVPKLDGAEMRVIRLSGRRDPLSLQLALHDDGTATRGEVSYDDAAYDEHDAGAIVAAFFALVESAVRDPHENARRLTLLEPETRTTILKSSSGPVAAIPETTVHALFEREADRVGERTAVVDGEGSITFAELDENANRLAHHLRSLGVGRNDAVGMCLERSTAMIVALLGILKAGAAYLPLNYEHPSARLEQQLQAADARIVVTQSHLSEPLGSFAGTVVQLDRDSAQIEACPSGRPEVVNEPDDAVYVMYTSGSTGVPKGATIKHVSLVNYALAIVERLGAHESETGFSFAAVSAISTDLGNTAIFPALVSGGKLHLVSPAASLDGAEFAAYARMHPIDVLKITPSHLKGLLATADPQSVLPHRWLVLGGEATSWELADELLVAGRCRILNHYGPTETTVGCCTYEVQQDGRQSGARTVPIGKPLRNTETYVVDENQQPLPIGAPGELFVGGAGVARGYVGQPEETELRFVADPFSGDPASRLYRTGDRVRYTRDGNLEFLGRIDEQVKIRGYRVEPGEVEAVLARHADVQQAAVVPVHDDGGPRLAAYLVARKRPSLDELRAHLRAAVPEFMVPSEFAFLDSLPLTPSGKVDRRALPDIEAVAAGRRGEYLAPRNKIEEGIAAIWAEVLGIERVGVRDDFFDLGGHSLMATQVIARVRSTFEAEVPLHRLFATPTVEGLAAAVVEHRPTRDEEVESLLAELVELADDEARVLLAGDRKPEGEQDP
jgi:amino acid adenylation domain-containing protein